MKTRLLLFVLSAYGLIWSGCNNQKTTQGLVAFINDPGNGITQEKDIQQMHLRLQYLPTDLQVLSDAGGMPDSSALRTGREKYKHHLYFKFTIRNEQLIPGGDSLSYLNFNMNNDMLLATDRDTMPCLFYQRINTGNKYQHEFVAVFEKGEQADPIDKHDFRFVYNDRIFGLRPVTFSFSANQLQQIPQL